jgi:hypothetical protein
MLHHNFVSRPDLDENLRPNYFLGDFPDLNPSAAVPAGQGVEHTPRDISVAASLHISSRSRSTMQPK